MKKSKQVLIFFLLVFSLSLFVSLVSVRQELSREMLIMGTMCRISIIADKKLKIKQAENALDKAFSLLKEYEHRWNFYSEESELVLINAAAANRPVKLLPDTFEIIKKSLILARQTNGVFDITATSLHKSGGYGTIILDQSNQSIFFSDANTKIDLGGIATGYAIDRIVELFIDETIENYLIDIGGDIYAAGQNKKNKLWEIGVRNPFDKNDILYDFSLENQAVTTSGNYIKQHIIDPQTSTLVKNNIISITVIADSCLEADVLATTFFIFGIEKTKTFIDNYAGNLQALFVENFNNSHKIVKLNWEKD